MTKLFVNSGDPDQMPHSDLGLHGLPDTLLWGFQTKMGECLDLIDTPQPLYNTIVGIHSTNHVS